MNEKDLHSLVWKRYIRMPYGHLLDCADINGNAVIPTAEECRAYIPSILAWTTPIADCAMFGGLYLYALCAATREKRWVKLCSVRGSLSEAITEHWRKLLIIAFANVSRR